ncbi:MAG: hypothetical protein JJE03_03950 [Peptostreptococcaceae bacterium]|nr:hypothetical protein [Peptostreptococcaceae bacterium]
MKALIIILIVLVVLFILLFVAYITNADGKLVEKTYDKLIKYHDDRDIEESI